MTEETEDEEDFSMCELEKAVKEMKEGKSAGIDELTAEMIKAAGPLGMQWLYRVMRSHKMTSFSVGDLVFAKLKGYRHWPAVITEIIKCDGKNHPKFNIMFCGDHKTAKGKTTELFSYSGNVHLYGIQQADNHKNKKLNEALREAESIWTTTHLHTSLSPLQQESASSLNTTQGGCPLSIPSPEVTNCSSAVNKYSELVTTDTPPNDSHILNNSIRGLELSILGDDPINSATEQEQLIIAAKIGSALLEENNQLKRENSALTIKLDNMEAIVEDLLTKEESHLVKCMATQTLSPLKHSDLLLTTTPSIVTKLTELQNSLNILDSRLQSLENKTADLNLYRDNPEMDNNVINIDNTFSCTLEQQELSDSEDTDTCQTRSVARKIIRNTAVNTNTGRISFLNIQDTNRISNLKTVAFVPEHTPLVTSQLHSDLDWERACGIGFYDKDTSICSLTLPSETLAELKGRVTSKELSYNNFATIIHDKKPYSIICYSSQHNNWKSKLFKFMETVNDCIQFPILFTISINELWHPIMPSKASTEEILQVVLQFNSNAYLHRYRFYTSDKKIKKTIDSILDTCFKHQLSLSRIASENDPTIYSTWRRRDANFNNDKLPVTTNTTAKDQNLEITESQAFIKAAMEEQKNAWRQAEGALSLSIQALETKIAASKIAYDVIDLSTDQPLLRLNPTKQYCYGFDGTRFIKLTYNNSKYTVDANTRPANKIILVSGETEVMNQLALYGGTKMLT
ncbi:PC4 and SFRS1-interacting protein [Homalodisca vitripennis]|nr:PC4 and SFRS1-interacting protein [Homalodisca vitripennis]